MPTEILMPALSPTMEEGKLAKWLVKEGQQVKAGDIIAEIETDKATMEVEAVDEGKVGKLLVSEGTEGVKVNTPIATLLGDGESEASPSPSRGEGSSRLNRPLFPRPAKADPATRPPKAQPVPLPIMPEACLRDTTANPDDAAPAPAPQGGGTGASRSAANGHGEPHLRLAAGAPARQGRRARSCGSLRKRPAWAHRQA